MVKIKKNQTVLSKLFPNLMMNTLSIWFELLSLSFIPFIVLYFYFLSQLSTLLRATLKSV